MKKDQIIDKIIPLHNFYKQNKDSIPANESIEIMWEIGDILRQYIEENDVKPHSLYREIYGKSEGQMNITQKITIGV